MVADSDINNHTFSAQIDAQSLYRIGMKMLPAYRNSQKVLDSTKAVDGAEPVSFYEFLKFMLEKKAKHPIGSAAAVPPGYAHTRL